MTPAINAMLESVIEALEASEDADQEAPQEALLKQAAAIFGSKYAKTPYIKGGPTVETQEDVTVLRGDLQPYNDAKVNAFVVVWRDGKAEIRAYNSIPSKDPETHGFQQVSAKVSVSVKNLTAEKLAAKIASLAPKMK